MYTYFGFSPYEGNENRIYLSHTTGDHHAAAAICEKLEKRGFRIWYSNGFLSGVQLREKVAERMENCTAVIAVLSKRSFAKKAFQRIELSIALRKALPVIPVFVEDIAKDDIQPVDANIFSYANRQTPIKYSEKKKELSSIVASVEERLISCGGYSESLRERRKERRRRLRMLPPESRSRKSRLASSSEKVWSSGEKKKARLLKKQERKEKRLLRRTVKQRTAQIEEIMLAFPKAQTVSECKALDNKLAEIGDVELVSWWLFNGEEVIQRNYAALYLRRRGEDELVLKAYEQGKIDRTQAFSH